MSAALQLSALALAASHQRLARRAGTQLCIAASASPMKSLRTGPVPQVDSNPEEHRVPAPVNTLAFYRKQTERLLRRYLYISMLVGRTPPSSRSPCSAVGPPIARSRPSKTTSFLSLIWRSASTGSPHSIA